MAWHLTIRRNSMSRRIKADRRNPIERNAVIEIINWVDYPGIPQDFVEQLKVIRNLLIRHVGSFTEECYREDWEREHLAFVMFVDEIDTLSWIMKQYHMIPDEDPPEFWWWEHKRVIR
jgi:hypothetical protein